MSDLGDALERDAAALGLSLSPAQRDQLLAYLQLLLRWNATYNLTAVRDAEAMRTQHLADCLAVVPPLRRHLGGREARLLDVGSGGGLPGVVLAVLMPSLAVTCVDTVGKKAAFVRQVAAELHLPNLRAEHARVERLSGEFDVITARAFATLAELITLTRQRLAAGGAWMAMKGKHPEDELAALPADAEVFHVEHLDIPGLAAERCLVWMRLRDGA
ncbi:MAG TPA: 16S rRNA (guanine(527)-N(7))-methyltransferase RsmG [Burkholderiaceae bacterium]|nr:16S rRNA (guanine(527)-N(7))-methyltransferase RsmG [Burkholderiaceae bacterium]